MDLEEHLPRLLDAATSRLQPPLDDLYNASATRGRRVLRRRAVTAAAASAAAVLGVATALLTASQPTAGTIAHGTSGPSPARTAPPGASANVQVDLAAWSVHTNADATITVTVRQGLDLLHLRNVLTNAGVHATFDSIGLVNQQPWCTASSGATWMPRIHNDNGQAVFTIDPAAIPTGTELHFVVFAVPEPAPPTDSASQPSRFRMSAGLYTGSGRACIVPTTPAGDS